MFSIPSGYYLSAYVAGRISNDNITTYPSFDNVLVLFITLFIVAVFFRRKTQSHGSFFEPYMDEDGNFELGRWSGDDLLY